MNRPSKLRIDSRGNVVCNFRPLPFSLWSVRNGRFCLSDPPSPVSPYVFWCQVILNTRMSLNVPQYPCVSRIWNCSTLVPVTSFSVFRGTSSTVKSTRDFLCFHELSICSLSSYKVHLPSRHSRFISLLFRRTKSLYVQLVKPIRDQELKKTGRNVCMVHIPHTRERWE